jgi:hypothetical protein
MALFFSLHQLFLCSFLCLTDIRAFAFIRQVESRAGKLRRGLEAAIARSVQRHPLPIQGLVLCCSLWCPFCHSTQVISFVHFHTSSTQFVLSASFRHESFRTHSFLYTDRMLKCTFTFSRVAASCSHCIRD